MLDIQKISDGKHLRAIVKVLRGDYKNDATGWAVLKEADLMMFRGVGVWVGFVDGVPVTLNATHFGKRKKNSWEPYANWYIAFTVASERRQGHAKHLARYVQNLACNAGCVRLKALAGTYHGLMLHNALEDQFWAITDKLEVQIDTPLVDKGCTGTPPNARKWTSRTTPMTVEEVLAELGNRTLRYCKGEYLL